MMGNRWKNILEEKTSEFINNISFELEKSHSQRFENFGFPMFSVTSNDYYEQIHFESYLESYTRKMINNVLKGITDFEHSDSITWPELESNYILNGYTNIEYEKMTGFEFINIDKKVGYRYTDFYYDEISSLLEKGKVDFIKLVLWQNENEPVGFEYADERVQIISLQELFQELFEDLANSEVQYMYDLFVMKVSAAINEARAMIALATIPGFTPAYLHKFRHEVCNKLIKDIQELEAFSVTSNKHKIIEDNSKKLIEQYDLKQNFLHHKYVHAFVGKSNFARSFLTSEYLYCHFKRNPMFDYTPIVCGYLKSIEQLLNSICIKYRDSKKIKCEKLKSGTMQTYISFIEENDELICGEVRSAKNTIIDCLNSYKIESRNNLFHKDYINGQKNEGWEKVEQIRNNTIFLYVMLLSMVGNDFIISNLDILKVLEEEYDRLFNVIDGDKSQRYLIEFNDEIYADMKKECRTEGMRYDKRTGLIENKIQFRKDDYNGEIIIELSPENIPSAIWSTDLHGKKIKLVWKAE